MYVPIIPVSGATNLGERKIFLPSRGRPIGTFFEILLSKPQKLGRATAPLAPPNMAPGFFQTLMGPTGLVYSKGEDKFSGLWWWKGLD